MLVTSPINSPFFTASTEKRISSSSTKNSSDVNEIKQSQSSIRKLAHTIDPTNMSRNEARQIADELFRSGDLELSTVFMAQSLMLIPLGNDQYRTATSSDAVMNEKFNMFNAIRSNITFKLSRGEYVENDRAAMNFLEKFQAMGSAEEVDTYA